MNTKQIKKGDRLKPCPFCGRNPQFGKMKAKRCQLHGEKLPQEIFVMCPSKHARFVDTSEEAVFAKWNTRRPDLDIKDE